MPTVKEPAGPEPTEAKPIDYEVAEGLREGEARRQWDLIGIGLAALVAVMALVVALIALAGGSGEDKVVPPPRPAAAPPAAPSADKPAPTLADSKGVKFE